MSIYTWMGPPQNLAGFSFITAERMTIDSVVDLPDGSKRAEGTFDFSDHMEGSSGHDPWEAVGTKKDGKIVWVVKRKDNGEFCFTNDDGELLFTLIEEVNVDIKKFVVSKLDEFRK